MLFKHCDFKIELKECFFGVFGVKIQVNNRFVTTNPYLIFQKAKRKKNRKWSRHRLDDFRAICHKCTVQCTPRHIARTSSIKFTLYCIITHIAKFDLALRHSKPFKKAVKDMTGWSERHLFY